MGAKTQMPPAYCDDYIINLCAMIYQMFCSISARVTTLDVSEKNIACRNLKGDIIT